MKAQQYREMAGVELEHKLGELRQHLFELKSQAVTEKLEDCRSISFVRRDIARIKTIIQEKQKEQEV